MLREELKARSWTLLALNSGLFVEGPSLLFRELAPFRRWSLN